MNYDYRPRRQNYKAPTIVFLLFLLSGGLFGCSGFLPPHSALWQSLGVLLLLPAVQLAVRYMISRYLYRLHTYEDGHTDLEIFLYRGGDKMQLVCCVALSEITAAAPLSAKNADAPAKIKRYNYTQDLFAREALVLSVTNRNGACEVLFSPDAYITQAITQALSAPRSAQTEQAFEKE